MSDSRPVTIADVAAASGFGVGTVSRVINRSASVRESTRATVLQAIERLVSEQLLARLLGERAQLLQ